MTNLSGATTAVFIIRLSAALEMPVTVAWQTKDGTAKAGTDYEAASGSVTFEPGETTKQIQVAVYGRAAGDTDTRTFSIELYPPENAILDQTLTDVAIEVTDESGIAVTSLVVATGPRGVKGDPGFSAYELAKLQGYVGTLEDWLLTETAAGDAADRAEQAAETVEEKIYEGTAQAISLATQQADRAESAAASAEAISDISNTFPDEQLGIAGTTSGEYFRTPQGIGSKLAFKYWRNEDGVAVPVAELAGQNAIAALTDNYNALSDQTAGILLELMTLTQTIDTAGTTHVSSDNSAMVYVRSYSLPFGGDTAVTIGASNSGKDIASRTVYPGETFADSVLHTPYRDIVLQGIDTDVYAVTVRDTTSVVSIQTTRAPDAAFDGISNTVFSTDGKFKTTTQGGQENQTVPTVAGGTDGRIRLGFPNSAITSAGFPLTTQGVKDYYASQYYAIGLRYRSTAQQSLSDTFYGLFHGELDITIPAPAQANIEIYSYQKEEEVTPPPEPTLLSTFNADVRNITSLAMEGIPSEIQVQFAPGEVNSHAALRLTDESGNVYPCQFAGTMDANLRKEADLTRYIDGSFNTGSIVFLADWPANSVRRLRMETYGTRGKSVIEQTYPKLALNSAGNRWEITVGSFTWQFRTDTGAVASVLKDGASISLTALRRITAITNGVAVENTNVASAELKLINSGPVFAELEQTTYHAGQGGVQVGDIKSVTRYRLFTNGAMHIYNIFRSQREIPANNLYGVRFDVELMGGANANYDIHSGASILTNVPFEDHPTWCVANDYIISDTLRDSISDQNTWGAVRPYPSVTMLKQGDAVRMRSGWSFTSLTANGLVNYVTPAGWTWPAGHWIFPYSVGTSEAEISNRVLNRPTGFFYRSVPTYILKQRIYQQMERLMDGIFDLYTNPQNGQVSATDYSGYRYPQVYGLYDALRNGENFDTRYGYFKTFITDKIGSYSNAGNAYLTGAWTMQFSGRMCFAAVEMYYRYAQKINNTTVMDDLKIFIASACDGLAQKIETSGAAPLGGNENNKGGGNSNAEALRMLAIGIYSGLDTSGRYQNAMNIVVAMMKSNAYATHAFPTIMDTFDSYPYLNRWLSYECHTYYVYMRACKLLGTTPEFDNSNYLMRATLGNGSPDYLRFIRAEDRRGFCETAGAMAVGLVLKDGISCINAAALLLDRFEKDWSTDPIAQPHLADFRQLTTPLTVAYEGFEHVANQFALVLLDKNYLQ